MCIEPLFVGTMSRGTRFLVFIVVWCVNLLSEIIADVVKELNNQNHEINLRRPIPSAEWDVLNGITDIRYVRQLKCTTKECKTYISFNDELQNGQQEYCWMVNKRNNLMKDSKAINRSIDRLTSTNKPTNQPNFLTRGDENDRINMATMHVTYNGSVHGDGVKCLEEFF